MYKAYTRRHRRRKTKNRIMTTPCTEGMQGGCGLCVAGQPSIQQTLAHSFPHNTIHFHTQPSLSHITLTQTYHPHPHMPPSLPHITLTHTSPHTHTSPSPPHILSPPPPHTPSVTELDSQLHSLSSTLLILYQKSEAFACASPVSHACTHSCLIN